MPGVLVALEGRVGARPRPGRSRLPDGLLLRELLATASGRGDGLDPAVGGVGATCHQGAVPEDVHGVVPATGREFTVRNIWVLRIVDGRMAL